MPAFGLLLGGLHAFGIDPMITFAEPPPPIVQPPIPMPGRRPPVPPVPVVAPQGPVVEIPLIPGIAQQMTVILEGIEYVAVFKWNTVSVCWVMDIWNANKTVPILCGTPLITGADLLAQYEYMEFGGKLWVITIAVGHPPDEVPGFSDLGSDGHLYFESDIV